MVRVLICGDLVWAHKECEDLFRGRADVVTMDSPNRAEFFAGLQPGGKYDGIVGIYRHNISTDHIGIFDKELVAKLPESVKWIAHNGAGYDQIDVHACKERGIVVSNTPGAVDDATATTALYLMISALRLFAHAEQDLRVNKWKASHRPGAAHDLTGRTLAILGLGGIGLRLAELARAFPMRVIYHSRRKVAHAPEWCEYYGTDRLDQLLAEADVLSVHVPLRADTEGFVGEAMIRKLKRGAVIVNTARGKVIDEAALIRALEDGHLGAVGLDVYPNEPEVNPRLLEFPNATLLPHMGTETCDSQKKMEVRALTNLRDSLTKGKGSDIIPEHQQEHNRAEFCFDMLGKITIVKYSEFIDYFLPSFNKDLAVHMYKDLVGFPLLLIISCVARAMVTVQGFKVIAHPYQVDATDATQQVTDLGLYHTKCAPKCEKDKAYRTVDWFGIDPPTECKADSTEQNAFDETQPNVERATAEKRQDALRQNFSYVELIIKCQHRTRNYLMRSVATIRVTRILPDTPTSFGD